MARIPSFGSPKKNQFSTLGSFDPTSGGGVNIDAMLAGGAGSQNTLPPPGDFDPASGGGLDFPVPPDFGSSLPGGFDVGAGSVIAQGGGGTGPMGFGSYAEWQAAQEKFNVDRKGFGTPGGGGGGGGGGRGSTTTPGGLDIPGFLSGGGGLGDPRGGGGASLGARRDSGSQVREDARNRQLRQEYLEDIKESRELDLPGEATEGVGRLVEEYNRAFGEAKGANEARYQQLLGITGETTGQRAADIRSRAEEERSDLQQGLARTGLSNTTVSPTLTAGSRRREEESLNRLADTMQGTKLGIIERREDAYPDSSSLQASLSALGQGYGGAGVSALYQALGNVRQS